MKRFYPLLALVLPLVSLTEAAAQPAKPVRATSSPAGTGAPAAPKEPTGPAYAAVLKYYRSGEAAKFMEALPALEKAHPASPWTLYFQSFVKQMSHEDPAGALKGYSDVIRLLPDEFGDAYLHRAELLADKGLEERAVADMTKAIALASPKVPAFYYELRADYQAGSGHDAEAIADFKKAIAIDGAAAKSYQGLVNLSQKAGTETETAALLVKALAGPQAANAPVRLAYAGLLTRTQQWPAADAEYDRALATAGFKPTAQDLSNAGVAARNVPNFSKAEALLERAIKLDPRNVDYVTNRASLAVDQQQWEAVHTWAQAALTVNDNDPMANMLMAVGIMRTNRGQAAAEAYETKAKRLEAARH